MFNKLNIHIKNKILIFSKNLLEAIIRITLNKKKIILKNLLTHPHILLKKEEKHIILGPTSMPILYTHNQPNYIHKNLKKTAYLHPIH